jgi:hypothetical protein
MIFETEQDLKREHKAITTFVSTFGGSFKKLDPHDIDYKVFDKDGNLIAYVEVKSIVRTLYNAYPLSITAKKIVKLVDKRLNPVVIWSCEDGIIYGKVNKLRGSISFDTSSELIIFYEKQKSLKYVRFV